MTTSVRKIAKQAPEGQLKSPLQFSFVADVDTTSPDAQTLLELARSLNIEPGASQHGDDVLRFHEDDFGKQFGFLLGRYKAGIASKKALPTLRGQQGYARRLEKYVTIMGAMPRDPQNWPSMVRYNPAVIDGASPLDAVRHYMCAVKETEGHIGQPHTIDKDRLIVDTYTLAKNFGMRPQVARQYTELLLGACGIKKVPKLGDKDGRTMRAIQERHAARENKRTADLESHRLTDLVNCMVLPTNR